jgi:hypothetical protein
VSDFTTTSLWGPATETWRNVLGQIPTVFGRLVFLSSLRHTETGRYAHPSLARLLGAEEADRTLCHSHHQVFSQWIASSLEEQKADLDEYLRVAGNDPDLLRRFRHLPPATAREVERQLYLTDLETLLELRRFAGDAFWFPETSQPQ